MLNNVMMTSWCPVMMSRYTSRWRLCFFRNAWPRKHRIQHKNHVIRANSSGDVEQCHDDVTVSRHDARVCVTMMISIYLINVSHCTPILPQRFIDRLQRHYYVAAITRNDEECHDDVTNRRHDVHGMNRYHNLQYVILTGIESARNT